MTAEDFLDHISENGKYAFDWKEFGVLFARYHVEQALKAVDSQAEYELPEGTWDHLNDKNFILNAYPLENIK